MVSATLHYVYDPLCGWCYGVAPLIAAARRLPGIGLTLHAGGMMSGANRQPVTAALRRYVMEHDQRIAALSGQTFGDDYFNGLLTDETAWFDSTPPIAAILAAEALAGKGAEMLAAIQIAHYQQGRRIADREVAIDLAKTLALPVSAFADTFDALGRDGQADAHISDSRALLTRIGGQGFPTLAIDIDGTLQRIDISSYLGKPDAFAAMLNSKVAA